MGCNDIVGLKNVLRGCVFGSVSVYMAMFWAVDVLKGKRVDACQDRI